MRAPAPDPKADPQLAHLLGAIANLNDTMAQTVRVMQTRDAARRIGADVRPLVAGSKWPLSESAGRIAGWNLRETGGENGAIVSIVDGADGNSATILTVILAKSGTETMWTLPAGISYTRGLYVAVSATTSGGTAGTVTGALYTL